MELKLCPICEKPYLATEEHCPHCPRDPFEGKEESYGSLGCIVISILALIGMIIFWMVLFLSFFVR
jgi:hypothetical protein